MKKDGGSAFPVLDTTQANDINSLACTDGGMTLRDYFAGQIFPKLALFTLEQAGSDIKGWKDGIIFIARDAYLGADALIAARETKPE